MKSFKQNIFKILTFAMLSLAIVQTTTAQEPEEESPDSAIAQSFQFVYIAQGNAEEMPIAEMEKKLETAWSNIQDGAVIFYLSRGTDSPIIVEANVDGSGNYEKEREAFDEQILNSLREGIQYSVDGAHDKQRILEILQKHDIVDSACMPIHKKTTFEFHVGQDFWDSGNNEIVIASLFFELNFAKYIKEGFDFHFNVFCPRKVSWNEAEGPFGILNPDECRRYINLDRSY